MKRESKPLVIVVMGVSGSGKTTVGKMLAERLGCPFKDGDELHPPANIAKMASGHALDDADRLPWLRSIRGVIEAWQAAHECGIIACSALKRRYRDIIIGQGTELVYLKGSVQLIHERLEGRHGHFMPASLLESQLADLEKPSPEENAIVVDVALPPAALVETIVRELAARRPRPQSDGPAC